MIGTEANDAAVMAEINITPFTDVLLVFASNVGFVTSMRRYLISRKRY